MSDGKTYMWKMYPDDNIWRIQTTSKKVYNKLNRRIKTTLSAWAINADLWIFEICYSEANNYNPNATNPDRSCQYGKVLTSLSFGYYDSVTGEIPIFIDTNENLSGFMFNISGAIILKAWGGIAEYTGYGRIIINDGQDGLYFFSYFPNDSKLGALMPKGNNQILINLIIETTSDENVCLEDIYLYDGSSEFSDDGNVISHPIKSSSFCFQP